MAETVEALRRSPLLEDLPDDALVRLAGAGTPVRLPPGAVLMAEGSAADAMYVVLDGELDVTKRIGEADLMLNRCGPGDPIGELGLVGGRPRSATVRAITSTRLLRIDAATFEDLLTAPGVAQRLLSAATRRLEQREMLMRQHARMATLGSLTAGLLHEVNNPAAALRRGAQRLGEAVGDWESAQADARTLAAVRERVAAHRGVEPPEQPSFDLEERLQRRLARAGAPEPWRLAGRLAGAGATEHDLEALARAAGDDMLATAARLLAARLEIPLLAATVREATARISTVIDAIKNYAHHDQAPVQQVSIHDEIDGALSLLGHRFGPGVRLVRDYAPRLPLVEGYPAELNSVWTNLVDNALDAIDGHGEVRIGTRAEPDSVVVEVTDDGPGVAPSVRERIFDPFVTTKPVGQGTGLGLAVAHAIVTRQHAGQLSFTSEPGRTTFSVRLPCRADRRRD